MDESDPKYWLFDQKEIKKIFNESKMSLLMQEIENKHSKVLEFNEFLMFITLLAIKLDGPGEPFTLSKFTSEKLRETQLKIALLVQELLIKIGETLKENKEDDNPFEEIDLEMIFFAYIHKTDAAPSRRSSTMSVGSTAVKNFIESETSDYSD